eukprot:3934134-Rhodomonas_salina.2
MACAGTDTCTTKTSLPSTTAPKPSGKPQPPCFRKPQPVLLAEARGDDHSWSGRLRATHEWRAAVRRRDTAQQPFLSPVSRVSLLLRPPSSASLDCGRPDELFGPRSVAPSAPAAASDQQPRCTPLPPQHRAMPESKRVQACWRWARGALGKRERGESPPSESLCA